jgi:hypothetical protein
VQREFGFTPKPMASTKDFGLWSMDFSMLPSKSRIPSHLTAMA